MTSSDAPSPAEERRRRVGRAAVFALVTAAVLFGVGGLVRSRWDPLISFDDDAVGTLVGITVDNPWLLDAAHVWELVTQPFLLHTLGTLLCLWAWLRRGMRTRAWWAFGTLMASWVVGLGAKYVFQRARPVIEDPVSEAPGYSFPSGHALNSAAFATTVVILLWPLVTRRLLRGVLVAAAVVLVAVTMADRMFLGVHYPSDVTVGVVTGAGLALASFAGFVGWSPRRPEVVDDPDATPSSTREESDGGPVDDASTARPRQHRES
ncbi:phosphatase PAP2 family protein [Phycicoccus sp. BSK3Z-2]|uniref:Phosphatase PAP2 family protein n=1 Tax=Phycicoccus avicenniae TaxID=2828860 RepID=A0A941D9H5_9MICO|nr:phosphatase PAP2 family protein [Phycicoccus avicenniae]MBR7744235.1 phosphatase PAP2 family protein [Phycicoccus avicenniae]